MKAAIFLKHLNSGATSKSQQIRQAGKLFPAQEDCF
jgi:hypothetical protein